MSRRATSLLPLAPCLSSGLRPKGGGSERGLGVPCVSQRRSAPCEAREDQQCSLAVSIVCFFESASADSWTHSCCDVRLGVQDSRRGYSSPERGAGHRIQAVVLAYEPLVEPSVAKKWPDVLRQPGGSHSGKQDDRNPVAAGTIAIGTRASNSKTDRLRPCFRRRGL
jgi:hypothetical protein